MLWRVSSLAGLNNGELGVARDRRCKGVVFGMGVGAGGGNVDGYD